MKATWTTGSGKTVELETKVIGRTAFEMIHTEYKMAIDGKPVNVTLPKVVNDQHCLEFVFPNTVKQLLLPISKTIADAVAGELKAVKDAVVPTTIVIDDTTRTLRR